MRPRPSCCVQTGRGAEPTPPRRAPQASDCEASSAASTPSYSTRSAPLRRKTMRAPAGKPAARRQLQATLKTHGTCRHALLRCRCSASSACTRMRSTASNTVRLTHSWHTHRPAGGAPATTASCACQHSMCCRPTRRAPTASTPPSQATAASRQITMRTHKCVCSRACKPYGLMQLIPRLRWLRPMGWLLCPSSRPLKSKSKTSTHPLHAPCTHSTRRSTGAASTWRWRSTCQTLTPRRASSRRTPGPSSVTRVSRRSLSTGHRT